MSWKVTTAPTIEPLTLDEVKEHLRLTYDDEDNYLNEMIVEARQFCEDYIDLAILEQTITLKMDHFPDRVYGSDSYRIITLPRTNLISVTSVKYNDNDGNEQTYTDYTVDTYQTPARIVNDELSWPEVEDKANSVTIVYKAGYGTDRSDVPAEIKRAMKMLISHWNSNREAAIVGVSISDVPMGVTACLDKARRYGL